MKHKKLRSSKYHSILFYLKAFQSQGYQTILLIKVKKILNSHFVVIFNIKYYHLFLK